MLRYILLNCSKEVDCTKNGLNQYEEPAIPLGIAAGHNEGACYKSCFRD